MQVGDLVERIDGGYLHPRATIGIVIALLGEEKQRYVRVAWGTWHGTYWWPTDKLELINESR